MWKAVYLIATGELLSVGTVVADTLPEGASVADLGEDRPVGEWNPITLVFDAAPVAARQISKLQFRELFAATKRELVDEFNATFEAHPALTAAQKRTIRTGLKDFESAQGITVPLDARVLGMLGLYQAVGILNADELAAIVSGAANV